MNMLSLKNMLCRCAALTVLAALSLPAVAQSIDAAKLAELQRIIANQQRMIEAQARTLEALKTQVDALITKTRATEKKVTKAVEQVKRAVAPPKMVSSGNDKVKLTLSGQVNRVSFIADDGTESNTFHSDNENSSTRWRLVGSAKLTNDFKIGTLIEQDIGQTNNSSSVDIDQSTSAGDVSFDNRHLTFYLDSKKFGRVWLGKLKMTGEVRLDDGKFGQMAFRTQENRKIRSSDGCGGKMIPTAAQFACHRHEIDANLGNVGLIQPAVCLIFSDDGHLRRLEDRTGGTPAWHRRRASASFPLYPSASVAWWAAASSRSPASPFN